MAGKGDSATGKAAQSFQDLNVVKQIGLMVGLAASVALGVAVVLWSQAPDYRPLYDNMTGINAVQVSEALAKANVQYKIDHSSGVILVPSSEVFKARMQLAKEGIKTSKSEGFELLDQNSGFGTSQFIEKTRYKRALQGELSRTITGFRNVKAARVHLALPKQSTFGRTKQKAKASVFVDLYPGQYLSRDQIASISNLVAASIPNLTEHNVTIVDQSGALLNAGDGNQVMSAAAKQLSYGEQLENEYVKQIDAILLPILGPNNFRAQVSAKIDFTHSERTKESFDSENPTLRSEEQDTERSGQQAVAAGGIPGQLAAQPPEAAGGAGENANAVKGGGNGFNREHVVRNYEVDKTITHTKEQPWAIKNISVAVVVNDQGKYNADTKETTYTARTPEQMEKITSLVRDAVGYEQARGDRVNVVNSRFAVPPKIEALPEPAMWEQAWFLRLVKQVLAGLFVLILVLGVLRPVLKALAGKGRVRSGGGGGDSMMMVAGSGAAGGQMVAAAEDEEIEEIQIAPAEYEKKLKAVKKMVGDDPKRVAQVVKSWVSDA